MVASQAVQHATPGLSFDAGSQKPAFTPIRVPHATVEAYRRSEPLFTEFLIESGRVIVEGMPNRPEGS